MPRVAGAAGRALLVDGLEVEQVGRLLGQQSDETPPVDRPEVGRVGAADRDLARAPRPAPLQRPQQRGLARAVAAHQRGDPAARQGQRHVADRHGPAVHHRETPDHHVRRLGGRCGLARRCQRERAGPAPGVPDAQRQRAPPGGPGELDQGRYDGRGGEHLGRVPDLQPSLGRDQADPVRERDHPLQPVLGEQHRDADVVDQPGERGEHVLGGGRVECGRRLVEHEEPRVHGQHRADRDPLLLPAGQGAQVARRAGRRCRAGRGSPRPGGASSPAAGRAAPCRRRAPPRRCR